MPKSSQGATASRSYGQETFSAEVAHSLETRLNPKLNTEVSQRRRPAKMSDLMCHVYFSDLFIH